MKRKTMGLGLGLLMFASFLWPRHRDISIGAGVAIFFMAFGAWAVIQPHMVRLTFAEGQATDGSRRRTQRTPLFAIRLLGAGFCAMATFVLYVIFFCPSYMAACMGPLALLGFGN